MAASNQDILQAFATRHKNMTGSGLRMPNADQRISYRFVVHIRCIQFPSVTVSVKKFSKQQLSFGDPRVVDYVPTLIDSSHSFLLWNLLHERFNLKCPTVRGTWVVYGFDLIVKAVRKNGVLVRTVEVKQIEVPTFRGNKNTMDEIFDLFK